MHPFKLLDDRSTFRGMIKTLARPIVEHRYRLIPMEDIPGQREYLAIIADNVRKLRTKGRFLRTEEQDAQVSSQCPLNQLRSHLSLSEPH